MVIPRSQKARTGHRVNIRSYFVAILIGGICFHRWTVLSAVEHYDDTNKLVNNTKNMYTATHSVAIIKEEDLTPFVFQNQSEFKIEYFSSMPECTPLVPDQVSFTLTTQLSPDRLWIMKHQCERWPSPLPIAIAIYLPPDTESDETSRLINHLENELHCDLTRMHITLFHASPLSAKDQYPVNVLRNLALKSISTTHAVYIDSDFLISNGLHNDLMSTTTHVLANDSRVAVVIPAFDYRPNCKINKQKRILACLKTEWDTIPKRYEDILALLDKTDLPRVDRGFQTIHGKNKYHGTTLYKKWTQNQSIAIPIPCIKTATYEPYLAIRVCRDLPLFPELFKGWGYNKVIWIKILLKKLAYRLWQLPHGFVVHVPHEISASRKSNEDGHPPEFDAYLDWLTTMPVHPNHLPHCVDWKKEHGPLQ